MPLRRCRTLAVDVVAAVPTEPLYREIRAVLESARSGAYRAVNAAMVQAYWHVGRLIVEHEQGGRKRAAYGEAVLDDLSQRLTADFGRGFDVRNLRYMRQFYLAFPIVGAVTPDNYAGDKRNALRSKSDRAEKRNAVRSELALRHPARDESPALRPELSWTHYSRKKAPARNEAASKLATVEPEQFIRDPYVLEFLDLKDCRRDQGSGFRGECGAPVRRGPGARVVG